MFFDDCVVFLQNLSKLVSAKSGLMVLDFEEYMDLLAEPVFNEVRAELLPASLTLMKRVAEEQTK